MSLDNGILNHLAQQLGVESGVMTKLGTAFFTFIGSGTWCWQKWTQLKIRGVISNLLTLH